MLFISAPKFCICIIFDFFWDHCNAKEWLESMAMQRFGGINKVRYHLKWKWRMYIKNWSSSPSTPPYKTSLLLILCGNWALPYTAGQWLNEREKGWGCWRGVDHTHSSLPADVLWGSFVTHSFLHPKGRLRGGYTHSPLPGRGVGKGVSVVE